MQPEGVRQDVIGCPTGGVSLTLFLSGRDHLAGGGHSSGVGGAEGLTSFLSPVLIPSDVQICVSTHPSHLLSVTF